MLLSPASMRKHFSCDVQRAPSIEISRSIAWYVCCCEHHLMVLIHWIFRESGSTLSIRQIVQSSACMKRRGYLWRDSNVTCKSVRLVRLSGRYADILRQYIVELVGDALSLRCNKVDQTFFLSVYVFKVDQANKITQTIDVRWPAQSNVTGSMHLCTLSQ